jgi:hypothetical protein
MVFSSVTTIASGARDRLIVRPVPDQAPYFSGTGRHDAARRVRADELAKALGPVQAAYRVVSEHLHMEVDAPTGDSVSRWLLGRFGTARE